MTLEKISCPEKRKHTMERNDLPTLRDSVNHWLEARKQLEVQSKKKKAVETQLKPSADARTSLKNKCQELEDEIIQQMEANNISTCDLASSKCGSIVISKSTKRKTLSKEHWTAGIEQFLLDNELDFALDDVMHYVRQQQELVVTRKLKMI